MVLMIIRNYLPYKSAREYCDRQMAKWMGFFLSEHTSALNGITDEPFEIEKQSASSLLVLISQSYLNNLTVEIYTRSSNSPLIGTIYELEDDAVFFESDNEMFKIQFDDIVNITLGEEI